MNKVIFAIISFFLLSCGQTTSHRNVGGDGVMNVKKSNESIWIGQRDIVLIK